MRNVTGLLTALGAVTTLACASDPSPPVAEVHQEVLIRCAGPSAYFKVNPQPEDCRTPTLAGVNGFHFYFSATDVEAQDLHVYFFNAENSDFFTVPPPSLADAISFHTEWDALRITRAWFAGAGGATEEIAVPADMAGAHHASTNNSGPSAFWGNAAGDSEPVSIARMHTCTYLRTR
jgi:hypothetical protein